MIDILPQQVDDLDLAFPADVSRLMPAQEDIPEEFKRSNGTKWNKVVGDWFFFGLKNAKWSPQLGIETAAALRHIKTILGSWEPKHEHKESAVAYLLSLWFKDVKYEKGKVR